MNCPQCNTHIDDHEASRCLDAWVAEAVFGDRPTYHFCCPQCGGDHFGTNMAAGHRVCHKIGCGWRGPPEEATPLFSAYVDAAWEVVEKIPHGITITRSALTDIVSITVWQGKVPGVGKMIADIDATDVPLAICQATITVFEETKR